MYSFENSANVFESREPMCFCCTFRKLFSLIGHWVTAQGFVFHLAHWGRGKMAAMLQAKFSNSYPIITIMIID